jgi:hypothetical protein
MPHRATEVDLLRGWLSRECRACTIGQHVHALFQTPGQPVEFPDNDGVNLTGKDGGLQFLKGFALKVGRAVAIFEPRHAYQVGKLQRFV